ncbi:shikimate 5-dehydrogenase [Celerinatantimonas diazotrophica]|uniref:Shikimate dehydrogenase n=1 Tax=Celerinatantimonas diazotrophica TaxID=412034 RepID=A0A4V2PR89_9GAMM|nr:shikimate 5-dehydrogenase [Celerinatantimonas diazotrophica]TCK57941.1 shikimate dehydrogenase [Celerinatantimonas diazotrophica]CAG9297991.1 Shikimate dehydrogenase-like protein [Celerinatantimonas diazotrophica]
MRQITRDTTLCMSLAGRPGNFGTRFHNYLYEAMGLDYLYKAFTTSDLKSAIAGIRALGIRGCAISMPFKEQVIAYVDELNHSADVIQSVNTIVNDNGYLSAYNTDYLAIEALLKRYQVSTDLTFALYGSGGMAKAVACALKQAGFNSGTVVARNKTTGKQLADLYGYNWQSTTEMLEADFLINVTPIGMQGANEQDLSFPEVMVDQAQIVFDVVAMPEFTPLIRRAQSQGKTVIKGSEVFALQAVEQFALYTGQRPDDELFAQAAAYARDA